ncbi:hypothetical protein [Pandoraea pulmonicola]|uniref:Uncharacterized protein n=1 Tax=Pandoraea pulmonicola TaxID=93221 RepID=A0AAJ4Z8T0_PANPU|nr:hypothetical protein [Pandoraea pulmonicola]AJC22119.1 hypothetical protein RO07_19430 [Pandoraea pulmonicola]SUA88872.1 Uncharacterised protein [Pandoraea pulmonicola]
MARLFGLLRTSLGEARVRVSSQARLSAVYGLSALSGPFAAAPATARSYTVPVRPRSTLLPRTLTSAVASATRRACPAGKAVKASRDVRDRNGNGNGHAAHDVRVYRDVSHIVMVGSIADICRRLDQAVGEQFCQAAV